MHPVVTWSLTDADQMETAIFFTHDLVLSVEKYAVLSIYSAALWKGLLVLTSDVFIFP